MVEIVVKVGGGLLADAGRLNAALAAIAAAAQLRRLLVVPGGGPFADAVRDADRRLNLSQTAAHWMAILAMDQYAHVIAAKLADAALVEGPDQMSEALDARRVPVLAPSRWLRDADPLPHSWDVTSDSIAAWVAGQVGARQLVLVKPPGVPLSLVGSGSILSPVGSGFLTTEASAEVVSRTDVVDPYFSRALPEGVEVRIIAAGETC